MVSSIVNCVDAIYANSNNINGKQFGGLMVWSLDDDQCDEWKPEPFQNAPVFFFADNVAEILHKN